MITTQTNLLKQLREYVDEYVGYLGTCTATATCDDVNLELRRIIAELEALQAHPDQKTEAQRLTQRVGDQLEHLRVLQNKPRRERAVPTRPQRTLIQAFQDYINQEIDYLTRVSGSTRREQTNALLSDVIADLKALALNPTDEQSLMLAQDLEMKRQQIAKLERPWQQMHGH